MSFELQIDLWRCLYVLWRKRVRIFLLSAAAFLVACVAIVDVTGNLYSATATVYSTAEGGSSLELATQTSTAMQRYAQVAQSLKVLNRAAELVGDSNITGQRLSGIISVGVTKDSSILNIKATASSPMLAVSAANAVSAAFVSEITAITGRNNAQVLDVAVGYVMVRNGIRSQWMMRGLAGAIAFACICGIILIMDICSRKVHSLKSASLNGDLEILGTIPDIDSRLRRGWIERKERSVPLG